MNATDQAKLCNDGYTIIRRFDSPRIGVKFKSKENPYGWRNCKEIFCSMAARDRFANRLLENEKTVED
jgi:hypothetical protein